MSMIYERAILWPLALIFHVHSCSSLSHSTRQFCLGMYLFTELRQCFSNGEFDLACGVPSSGTWTQSDANTKHRARGKRVILLECNGMKVKFISVVVILSNLCNRKHYAA